MSGYFPEHPQDAEGVQRILTLDWISRKDRSWPLVPYHTISTQFPLPPSTASHLLAAEPPKQTHPHQSQTIKQTLLTSFPALKQILSKYRNKIAVCGGILCRAAVGSGNILKNDCDLFFYGCDKVDEGILLEYREMLEDCVGMIASVAQGKVAVDRSDYVVNVCDHFSRSVVQYQFVLRIYGDLGSVIGGFDIGPSMIAFDGEEVYTTQLGAWSYGKMAMIVDTTRRSRSYEYRISKYHKMGFKIVFPGFDIEKLEERRRMFLGEEDEENCRGDEVKKTKYVATLNRHFGVVLEENRKVVLKTLRPRNVTKEQKLECLKKYSDYTFYKPARYFFELYFMREKNCCYLSLMKNNQRSGLFVCSQIPNDYEEARRIFKSLIDNPQIKISEEQLKESEIKTRNYWNRFFYTLDSKKDCRIFAEYYPDFQELVKLHKTGSLKYEKFISNVINVLNQRILENSKNWEQDFKGLKWRTQDPGTQHTASINPIFEDPRKFYWDCYKPFFVGIPKDVENCVWVIFKERLCFPAEIVRIIVKNLVYETHIRYVSKTKKRKWDDH